MNTLSLAIKNLHRNKTRLFLTIAGIATSTAIFFAILSFHRGFDRELSKELTKTGVHFMIVPSGCPHEVASLILHGSIIPKLLDPEILQKIKDSEHLSLVAPILVFQSPNEKRAKVDVIYGLPMDSIKALKPHWEIEGRLPKDENEILLGYEIASHDKLKVGDSYSFSNHSTPLVISGIVKKTGSQDDAFVYTSLEKAQEIFGKGNSYTALAVQVKRPEKLYEITESLASQIPGIQIVTISQVMNALSSVANSAKMFGLSVAIVALVVSAVGVMNSVLMSAFERRQETGMMRAIGASKADVFRLYCIETVAQTTLGGVIGVVMALFASNLIEAAAKKLIPYSPPGKLIMLDYDLVAMCIGLSLFIGLIVGLFPAWLASRVSPVEVIRA